MARMNSHNYITRRTGKNTTRNWWTIKSNTNGSGFINLATISFPKCFTGKKIMVKIEFAEA